MLSGRRFRLSQETLGIESKDNARLPVSIPEGSAIEGISGPTEYDMQMIQVRFEGRALVIFAEDIQRFGEDHDARRQALALRRRPAS